MKYHSVHVRLKKDNLIDQEVKVMKNLIRRILKEEVEETSGEKHPNAEEIKKGKKTGCYKVNSGDQLLKIALAFGITLDDIKALNGKRNDSISPGEVLRVQNRVKFDGC
jgi:LysM repeat protein